MFNVYAEVLLQGANLTVAKYPPPCQSLQWVLIAKTNTCLLGKVQKTFLCFCF